VQRGFRRQYLELAEDHGLPFRLAGPGLALLQEISERPGVTVNEVARLTGLPKSQVSRLWRGVYERLAVQTERDFPAEDRGIRLRLALGASDELRQLVFDWARGERPGADLFLACDDEERS